nr:hypothetical protein CFP56_46620 [Quercus suber]
MSIDDRGPAHNGQGTADVLLLHGICHPELAWQPWKGLAPSQVSCRASTMSLEPCDAMPRHTPDPTSPHKQEKATRLTPDVPKLAILEDDKLLPPRNLVQPADGPLPKVGDDVRMSFEHADVVADLVGQPQQLGGGGDIRAHTQVRSFDLDQTEEVGCERGQAGLLGALAVGLEEGRMATSGRGRRHGRPGGFGRPGGRGREWRSPDQQGGVRSKCGG